MYKKLKGKNGLTVIASNMPHMASVTLGVWIGVGGRHETEKQSGISHLIEHMLFKGTHSRSTKQLKEAIEGVGGAFNGFTSDEVTCYMVKVPSRFMDLGVDILSDMVMDPRVDEADLVKEKFVVCEEIKMYRDQPADHVLDVLGELMWPGSALGRPLTGTMSTVKSLTRNDIVKFKEKNYHPSNIVIAAAGNVQAEKLFKRAMKRFTPEKKRKKPSFKKVRGVQKAGRIRVCRGDTSQTHIALGFHVPGDTVRERFNAKLMNVILGGNMSSRLFEELREKHGLCYDIASSYKRHSDVGELHVHAGVDNRNAVRAVTAIFNEIRVLRDAGVTEEELGRAKEYAKGQFLLGMESTSSRMMWIGDRIMVHGNVPEVKDVLKRIDSVTPEGIRRVSEKIFSGSSANLAMIGKVGASDRNRIKREMNRL